MRIFYLPLLVLVWVSTFFFYTTQHNPDWQWVWLLGYMILQLTFYRMREKWIAHFSFKRVIYSVILACAWGYSSHTHALSRQSFFMWIVTVVTLIGFSFTFYCLIYWLEQPFSRSKIQTKWWWGILYGAVPTLVWLTYFLVYFPGKMTFDSFWQWAMAHHVAPYNSWHPVLHTWLIEATTWVYNSPAVYTIAQILLVSVIIGYALFTLQSFGVPVLWVIFIDLVYALNPVNGFYAITMWKDIPFAAFILLFTVLLAKVLFSKGVWLKHPAHMAALIAVAFIAMNLRDNGFAVVIAALILFIVFVKGSRKRMTLVAVPVIVLYYLYSGPLMNALHVVKNPLNQALAIPSQQIAATYKAHGRFTPELSAYFNSILPAQNWIKDYQPYTVDPIKHDVLYNSAVISQSFSTYLKNWVKLLALNPKTFVNAYLDQVSVIWKFQSPGNWTPYFDTNQSLQDYPIGLKLNAPASAWKDSGEKLLNDAYQNYVLLTKTASTKLPIMSFTEYKRAALETYAPLTSKSMIPQIKPVYDLAFAGTFSQYLRNYLLKGAIPLIFLLLGLAASIRRWGLKGVGAFLPAGFVLITIAMALPAPDYRYCFSFVFCVPFLLLLGKLEVD